MRIFQEVNVTDAELRTRINRYVEGLEQLLRDHNISFTHVRTALDPHWGATAAELERLSIPADWEARDDEIVSLGEAATRLDNLADFYETLFGPDPKRDSMRKHAERLRELASRL